MLLPQTSVRCEADTSRRWRRWRALGHELPRACFPPGNPRLGCDTKPLSVCPVNVAPPRLRDHVPRLGGAGAGAVELSGLNDVHRARALDDGRVDSVNIGEQLGTG